MGGILKSKKLLIFGNGDFARLAYFYFSKDSEYEVVAFVISKSFLTETTFLGLPLIPFEEIEQHYSCEENYVFVAIGYSNLNKNREKIYFEVKSKGYRLATYLSSKATILSEDIGENTFIFEDNTIQPYVKIKNNVILWSGNHIGHDAIVCDHCFITSHVVLAGWTEIGIRCFIGINATVIDHVKIGESCVIGANALITKNAKDFSVFKPDPTLISKVPSYRLRSL